MKTSTLSAIQVVLCVALFASFFAVGHLDAPGAGQPQDPNWRLSDALARYWPGLLVIASLLAALFWTCWYAMRR